MLDMETSFISNDYVTDEIDENDSYLTAISIKNDFSRLFHRSNLSNQVTARRLIYSIVGANIDKRESIPLRRLMKIFLGQPNNLPKFWKRLLKLMEKVMKSITDLACVHCNRR